MRSPPPPISRELTFQDSFLQGADGGTSAVDVSKTIDAGK
jgi:hypothetical protein